MKTLATSKFDIVIETPTTILEGSNLTVEQLVLSVPIDDMSTNTFLELIEAAVTSEKAFVYHGFQHNKVTCTISLSSN